jgi:hypothetical protein
MGLRAAPRVGLVGTSPLGHAVLYERRNRAAQPRGAAADLTTGRRELTRTKLQY